MKMNSLVSAFIPEPLTSSADLHYKKLGNVSSVFAVTQSALTVFEFVLLLNVLKEEETGTLKPQSFHSLSSFFQTKMQKHTQDDKLLVLTSICQDKKDEYRTIYLLP